MDFRKLEPDVFGTARTGWPATPISADLYQGPTGVVIDYEIGERNSKRRWDYSRVDVRLSKSHRLRNGELTDSFEVFNLFDSERTRGFDDVFLYTDRGGNLRGELDYNHWPPRLPSLGITWTFR